MKIFVLFLVFFSLAQVSASPDGSDQKSLVTFKLNPMTKSYLLRNGYDVAGVDYNNGLIDVFLDNDQIQELKALKMNSLYEVPQHLMKAPDPEYKNAVEIEAELKNFNQKYKDLTTLKSIGYSVEGRPIWAIKISDNPSLRELNEPTILFNSAHHAREIMTPEIGLDIIGFLLSNYNTSDEVRNWVDQNEIWVIPMVNVDGNNIVWTKNFMWRKNAQGGHGVDLNRNYPAGWNSCNGSSAWTFSDTYRGPTPASEPETQSMMKFVEETKPVFNISYHSYSELVLYPYGCEGSRTQTKEVVESIGKEIGQKLSYRPGTAWELLYNADGGDIDWMYQEHQVIPYVLEVNSSKEGFQPDYNEARDVTVERNRAGWQHLLNRLNGPGVRGIIQGRESVVIDVLNNGKSFQKYKVNPDGTFHIVLPQGEYSLNFIAAGRAWLNKEVVLGAKRLDLGNL